jgi:hypothetical protein
MTGAKNPENQQKWSVLDLAGPTQLSPTDGKNACFSSAQ